MNKENEVIGTIEEVVRDARLVDKGKTLLNKWFYNNAPSFDPERRKFLKHTAVLAGLIASGKFLEACSTIEPVQFQGKSYGSWEAWLMSQDLIRGPGLLIHPRNGLPNDFKNHIENPINQGFGAVDYDVSIGTPIVPPITAFRTITSHDKIGGNVLELYHKYGEGGYHSLYAHLDEIAEIISKGAPYTDYDGIKYKDQLLNMLKIVAFSGNTGTGPGGGPEPQHLHFRLTKIVNKNFEKPGINPFEAGIDAKKPVGEYGGRPVYWDGKTRFYAGYENLKENNKFLLGTLDTLEARVKESDLDNTTKEELLKLRSNPEKLRDYLAMRVLVKKRGPDGKSQYEFLPGSLMYALNIELINRMPDTYHEFPAFLPFIFPILKPVYQKANTGVKF